MDEIIELKKNYFFYHNEPPQIPKMVDVNELEPPENMSTDKQQFMMKMLSIFITCYDCKFFFLLFNKCMIYHKIIHILEFFQVAIRKCLVRSSL